MANLFKAEDKTFLVTGGASGLGAQYVEAFVKQGAKAVAILDVQVDNGTKLAERLNKAYNIKVIFIKCDVSNEREADEAFTLVLKELKQLDVIINNAGIMVDNPNGWRKACDVNWQGLVDFTLKGIKHMRKDTGGAGGTIINVSSVTGLCRLTFLPIYCGSKAAVLHFSQSISGGAFFETTGVRILTVCFGPTATPLLDDIETRTWEPISIEEIQKVPSKIQTIESAVKAVIKLFEEGSNGSIWLSNADQPAKDITPLISSAFTEFEKAIAILDVQVDSGKNLAERSNKEQHSKVIFIKCDVSNENEADDAFKLVIEQFKRLDVINDNAGIMIDNLNCWKKACNVNWVLNKLSFHNHYIV